MQPEIIILLICLLNVYFEGVYYLVACRLLLVSSMSGDGGAKPAALSGLLRGGACTLPPSTMTCRTQYQNEIWNDAHKLFVLFNYVIGMRTRVCLNKYLEAFAPWGLRI